MSLDNHRVDSAHVVEELRIDCFSARELLARRNAVVCFLKENDTNGLNHDPRWLEVLPNALGHVPYLLQASRDGLVVGILPLMLVSSLLFRGRFLVSLPYLNGGGVLANDPSAAAGLIRRAFQLADELDTNFLELRHETAVLHDHLLTQANDKVHMRLALPNSIEHLWSHLKAKVRNQVRKAESHEFSVHWGGQNLVREFHQVFSRNMRDLGTPVYGRRLFQEIIATFGEQAESCILRLQGRPVAAALLMHGAGVTEVPSASSLREYNKTNANMLMYWHLLCRAVERGQRTFDFGRSTEDSGTYRFKKQWGASPTPAAWQYYIRHGEANQMRPDSGNYDRLIRIWKKLPVPVTRVMGPLIVRGIP